MRILITGLGFISSHVIRHFVELGHDVTVATRNTYATKFRSVADVLPKIKMLVGDLAEPYFADQCAMTYPEWVVHMAAETHVDNAIKDPACFVRSNTLATTNLLQAIYNGAHETGWPYKIIVYSTDEVFGSTPVGKAFTEDTPYNPSNAYSASKVGIEAIANAFRVTHKMPIIIVRPCNTYGPGQHPEKVIPKFVKQMLLGVPITVYNDGKGARDWLHVKDHARAIQTILEHGTPGQSYNMGAWEEHSDQEIADLIVKTLAMNGLMKPTTITYVPGRPGHDRRYFMDNAKLKRLGWKPEVPFGLGFEETVLWNADHQDWWSHDEVSYAAVAAD